MQPPLEMCTQWSQLQLSSPTARYVRTYVCKDTSLSIARGYVRMYIRISAYMHMYVCISTTIVCTCVYAYPSLSTYHVMLGCGVPVTVHVRSADSVSLTVRSSKMAAAPTVQGMGAP